MATSKSDARLIGMMEESIAEMKKAGADYAVASISEGVSAEVSVRLGKTTGLQRPPKSTSISLAAYVGDRMQSVSPDTARPEFLIEAARDVVAAARLKTPNPDIMPPPRELLSRVHTNKAVDPYDRTRPSTDQLIAMAKAAEDAALSVPGVTNSEGSSASWSSSKTLRLTSDGFLTLTRDSHTGFYTQAIAGNGDGKVTSSEGFTARYLADLKDPVLIGTLAGKGAVAMLNAKKPPMKGKMPVIFDPDMASGLLQHFAVAASGNAVFMGQTFLKNSLGKQVFPRNITIVDNPLLKRGLDSDVFTGSGLPTRALTVVENGELKSFFHGLESARRLGLPLTVINGGASNLSLEPGFLSPEELYADVEDGLYVTSLMGQGFQIVNGDYSRGAKGFWIRNGELAFPVDGATIAGNLRDMFLNAAAANDLDRMKRSVSAPTLRIDGMTIA